MLTRVDHLLISYLATAIMFSNAHVHKITRQYRNFSIDRTYTGIESHLWVQQILYLPQKKRQYLETIRWKLVPQKDEFANRFFLTHTGNEFCKISETIHHTGEE